MTHRYGLARSSAPTRNDHREKTNIRVRTLCYTLMQSSFVAVPLSVHSLMKTIRCAHRAHPPGLFAHRSAIRRCLPPLPLHPLEHCATLRHSYTARLFIPPRLREPIRADLSHSSAMDDDEHKHEPTSQTDATQGSQDSSSSAAAATALAPAAAAASASSAGVIDASSSEDDKATMRAVMASPVVSTDKWKKEAVRETTRTHNSSHLRLRLGLLCVLMSRLMSRGWEELC